MKRLTDEEKVLRGIRAENVLKCEGFEEVMGELRETLLLAVEQTQVDDPEPVMAITRQLRAVRQIRGKLEAWVSEARTIQMQRGELNE